MASNLQCNPNKEDKMNKYQRITAALILILFLTALAHLPALAQDNTEICNRALLKCGVDAVIAGLLSGMTTLAFTAMGCLIGYDWCLKYYLIYCP